MDYPTDRAFELARTLKPGDRVKVTFVNGIEETGLLHAGTGTEATLFTEKNRLVAWNVTLSRSVHDLEMIEMVERKPLGDPVDLSARQSRSV